jgi:hypothetical protein
LLGLGFETLGKACTYYFCSFDNRSCDYGSEEDASHDSAEELHCVEPPEAIFLARSRSSVEIFADILGEEVELADDED